MEELSELREEDEFALAGHEVGAVRRITGLWVVTTMLGKRAATREGGEFDELEDWVTWAGGMDMLHDGRGDWTGGEVVQKMISFTSRISLKSSSVDAAM